MSNQELTVFSLVEQQEQFFMPVLTDKSVSWAKEKQFAIQYLQSNEFLATTAMKNQASLQNAIINVASIGISLNPADKHAYLVPRDGKVCLDISYMGLAHLATSDGSISWCQSKIVREADTYTNKGIDKEPLHEYKAFGDRGPMVGVYCTVKLPNGDYLTDEMSLDDIKKIMETSKSASSKYSPWKTFFNEMARKTVVKRAAKYWPAVRRLNDAIHHLNEEEGIELETVKPVKGTTNPGMNPDILPIKLKNVYDLIREAYEAEDLQCVCEMLDQFSMHEEQIPVWKCFASFERTKISKFKKEEYTQYQDIIKVEYLNEEELTALCKQFNFD